MSEQNIEAPLMAMNLARCLDACYDAIDSFCEDCVKKHPGDRHKRVYLACPLKHHCKLYDKPTVH